MLVVGENMSNYVDMMKRTTRSHPGLVWESENVHTAFTDINRVALDDRYGKVGASIYKRKGGEGPAGRDAPPGLFGSSWKEVYAENTAYRYGFLIGAGLVLYYLSTRK